MKTLFISTIVFFCATGANAQDYSDKQNIKVVVEQDAHYPKGEMALYQYIFKNIKYSEEAKTNKAEGEVMASFFVESDSTIKSVNVLKGMGYGIDEEVKRLLMEMKFAPAIQNGEPIRMNLMMNFPVRAH